MLNVGIFNRSAKALVREQIFASFGPTDQAGQEDVTWSVEEEVIFVKCHQQISLHPSPLWPDLAIFEGAQIAEDFFADLKYHNLDKNYSEYFLGNF